MTKTYQLSSEGIGFLGRQFLDMHSILIVGFFFFFLTAIGPIHLFEKKIDGAQTQILGLVLCTVCFRCVMDTKWHNMLPHVHYKLKAMYNKTQIFVFGQH
jgi:hypothetical protein